MKSEYESKNSETMKKIWFAFVVLVIFGLFGENVSAEPPQAVEFAQPIKNITANKGTNVEFSCAVRNLENHRVMWLQREGEREIFLAINSLKVTKNPRMTVSLLQSSGDVTQSILYVYNVEKKDSGVYECAVNIQPTLNQIGTLDVVDITYTHTGEVHSGSNDDWNPTSDTKTVLRKCTKEITNDCTIDDNQNEDNDNVFCIDFGQLWEKARLKVDRVLSSMYTFFMKITA